MTTYSAESLAGMLRFRLEYRNRDDFRGAKGNKKKDNALIQAIDKWQKGE